MSTDQPNHMPRCGTCKHFKADISIEATEGMIWSEKEGTKVPIPGYGQCGRVEQQPTGDGVTALVTDGSGYFAALICTKDFGCVLHESVQ